MKKLAFAALLCVIALVALINVGNSRTAVHQWSYYDFMRDKQVVDLVEYRINDPENFTQCRRIQSADYVEVQVKKGKGTTTETILLREASPEERAKWNTKCESIARKHQAARAAASS